MTGQETLTIVTLGLVKKSLTKKLKYLCFPSPSVFAGRESENIMKKTSRFGITLAILLLMSAVVGLMLANSVSADADIFVRHYLPELVIKSDGTITGRQVTPQEMEFQAPEFIIWTGNIYTLTADIDGYAVVIECNNIVLMAQDIA